MYTGHTTSDLRYNRLLNVFRTAVHILSLYSDIIACCVEHIEQEQAEVSLGKAYEVSIQRELCHEHRNQYSGRFYPEFRGKDNCVVLLGFPRVGLGASSIRPMKTT